jgi:formylglycine-generating enzyme required for sulfatase activity
MMEATGKGNCMFARYNTFKHLPLLILISGLLCVSHSQAQQQPEVTDDPGLSATESVDTQGSKDSRHIERLGEVSTDEWELDLALPSGVPAASPGNDEFSLPDSEQDQQLQHLLSRLAANPGNAGVLAQLNTLLADVLLQANGMLDAGSFDQAGQMLSLIQSIDPDFRGLSATKERIQALHEANELLISGNAALASRQFIEPENSNALYYFKQALSKDPGNRSVQLGIARVQEALVQYALESARELDFEMAEEWLLEASAVRENQQLVEDARVEVARFQQERAVELEKNAINAMNSGNFGLADFNIIDLIALGGQQARVESLRERLKEARVYGGFETGQIISDTFLHSRGKAPDIVVIAAGSFLMGSNSRSGRSPDNEQPRHRVTFEHGFAIGVKEVTVAEFRLFINSSGYRTAAERMGKSSVYDEAAGRLRSRDRVTWEHDYLGKKAKPGMPVLHVNFHDARAYVEWLARQTGKAYRLPSEAEFEYVSRAGGRGTYWWGEGSPDEAVENLTGSRDSSPSKREWSTSFKNYGDGHWGPAPSGTLADGKMAHPMGVRDIAGNVCEWTEDCWHQNYVKAPIDGSAWVNPGCKRRVVRGGYWASAPEQSRAAFRVSAKPESYGPVFGFRVARDL